jgi:hypothetical protein
MMRGLMQDWPLLCHKIIDHAAIQHGTRDVVSRSVEGPMHRTNYREIRERARRAAKRLDADGWPATAGTLAWNTGGISRRVRYAGIGAIITPQPVPGSRSPTLPITQKTGAVFRLTPPLVEQLAPKSVELTVVRCGALPNELDPWPTRNRRRGPISPGRNSTSIPLRVSLHVRHDGQPKGVSLAPFERSHAFLEGRRMACAATHSAGRADVPRQCWARFRGADGRRCIGDAGPA